MPESKKLSGHRARMREMLNEKGAGALSDIDMLEMLLFHCIARSDTRKTAEALIKKFGSFSSVLVAPKDQLLKVEGIGESSAIFLTQMPDFARYFIVDIERVKKRVFNTETAYEQMRHKFTGLLKECVAVMLLNSRGQVIFNDILWHGSVAQVPVYVRELVALCLHYEADTIIMAHNHPSGNPAPSKGDISATKELQIALDGVYVGLEDHLIITDTDYTSLAKSGWLSDIATATDMYRKNILLAAKQAEESLLLDE